MKNIYDLLDKKKSANINNTNNYNNTNNTNNELTTTTLCNSNDEEVMALTPSSLGLKSKEKEFLDSKSKEKVALELPAEWRGVKLDLFCNGTNKDGSASLKLNIGVIRKLDGAQVALQASLNSSWDSGVRRGVDAQDWSNESHWIKVKQHRKELEYIYKPRFSKIGLKQKAGGTEMVAFVYKDRKQVWCADIVREGSVYSFELTDQMSAAQSESNLIATAYVGVKKRPLIKAKELGI
jgi:hypothetical protein